MSCVLVIMGCAGMRPMLNEEGTTKEEDNETTTTLSPYSYSPDADHLPLL